MFSVTDDEDFFAPTSSNNLAALFKSAAPITNNSNVALTYNAPRQQKPITEEPAVGSTEKRTEPSTVLCAKPVNLYKLTESFIPLGKYALAVIGTSQQVNEIILYKDKRNILTRVKTPPSFEFSLQSNKFLCFTDNNKQFWSTSFESVKHLDDFLHVVQTHNIKVLFNKIDTSISNKQSDNLDNNNKTEANNVNIVQAELQVPVNPDSHENIDSPNSQTRAHILSRMAKMGQSILPTTLLKNNILSDSETDDSGTNKIILNRKPKIKRELPLTISTEEKLISDKNIVTTLASNPQFTNQPYTLLNGQLIPMATASYSTPHVTQSLPSNVIMSTLPSAVDNLNLNMYISENRMHNSEIRMNLSAVTSKLDNIIGEISKIKLPTDIDQLENEFLKTKMNSLETKIRYLTKTLEEKESATSHELAKFVDELGSKDKEIVHLKEKTVDLERRLLEETSQMRDEIKRLESVEENLTKTTKAQQSKLRELEKFCEEKKNFVDQNTVDSLKDEIVCLNKLLTDMKAKRHDFEQEKVKTFSEGVKQSMNLMFQKIMKDFIDKRAGTTMQSVLTSSLKSATYEIIQHFQHCLSTTDGENPKNSDYNKLPPAVPEF